MIRALLGFLRNNIFNNVHPVTGKICRFLRVIKEIVRGNRGVVNTLTILAQFIVRLAQNKFC